MERYKTALEIIYKLCKEGAYTSTQDIKLICETVLKESEEEENELCSR